MAELALNIEIRGGGTLKDTGGINPAIERGQIGAGDFEELVWSLSSGTGNEQANQWYLGQRTLNATSGENLDLTALTNKIGSANLAKVRGILVRIKSPDGTKLLRVGPQNQTNGWQGPFAVTDGDGWIAVTWLTILACSFANGIGAVSGTNKVLRVYNPGAGAVIYDLWIIGVQ